VSVKKNKSPKINIDYKKLRKLEPTKNAFASLVRSIIFQQLSGKAAQSILNKFLKLWPNKKFPKPEDVLILKDKDFRNSGVSLQKANYLRDLSKNFIDKTINSKKFSKMTDEEIREHLIQVKGIGRWTADMFLIFALNRPNVLPVGDLAIVKGFQKLWNLNTVPSEEKMRELAKDFDGEHTYLSLYLWNVMDEMKEKKNSK
jgi:DNA-3-methyladenine glycosylase II